MQTNTSQTEAKINLIVDLMVSFSYIVTLTQHKYYTPELVLLFFDCLGPECLHSHTAVSYTHLDVYKRQIINSQCILEKSHI